MSNVLKFVDVNTTSLFENFKLGYEEIMGVTVKEGDPINDFISWVTYIFSVVQNNINYTGKMNLLRYSEGLYLEAIGELVGVNRITSTGAKAKIKYTFGKIFPSVVTIPKGHKIAAGNLYFELDEAIELKIGERETYGTVTCITPGIIGNNISIGDINTVVDAIAYLNKIENITISAGGSDEETDEQLRERIRLKPTSFSTAGPIAAYKYYTLTAHPDIYDTYIYTPLESPGVVKVIPLLKGGTIPQQEILETIENLLADGNIRPFTDKVEVIAPTAEEYNINVNWWLSKDEDISIVTDNVNKAIEEFKSWQKEKLWRDINPNKLVQLLINAGVKRVEIIEPIFTKIDKTKVAQESESITISYKGVEDE